MRHLHGLPPVRHHQIAPLRRLADQHSHILWLAAGAASTEAGKRGAKGGEAASAGAAALPVRLAGRLIARDQERMQERAKRLQEARRAWWQVQLWRVSGTLDLLAPVFHAGLWNKMQLTAARGHTRAGTRGTPTSRQTRS